MSIRPAIAPDLFAVSDCARLAYEMYVPRIGREPAPMVADFETAIARHHLHVFEAAEAVAGFIVFYPREDHVHIENVAVAPQYQGSGIGKRLIAYAERHTRDYGFGKIELYTNEKMTENIAYYPRLGFEETGRGEKDGFNRVYFRKVL